MNDGPLRLGVNIDHVATLRQLRAGTVDYPDILAARDAAIRGGADQITVHLRGDRRHIQEQDLKNLAENRKKLLNLEMAATPEMTKVAILHKPNIICLVPEKREEVTTEGGLNVLKNRGAIELCVAEMKKFKIRVSFFIEPDSEQIGASRDLGGDAVEFHTGQYAIARAGAERAKHFAKLEKAFDEAARAGLAVHAGHGLDYENVKALLSHPSLEELNIGHSIVCRAVMVGLERAVAEMKEILERKGK